MSSTDPRSRIVLHMNWKGQALPILLGGLPSKKDIGNEAAAAKKWHALAQPPQSEIASISPYAQIICLAYRTPTFLIHGTRDDLIPWEQTKRTHDALVERGIRSGCVILDDAVHLFDLYVDPTGKGFEAVEEGYRFLLSCL